MSKSGLAWDGMEGDKENGSGCNSLPYACGDFLSSSSSSFLR